MPTVPSPPGSTTPYVFVGRMIDRRQVTLFLIGNNHPILAKVNDVIDGTYRVDQINATNAVLTYLPTQTQQTVVFNSTAIGASVLTKRGAEREADGTSAIERSKPAGRQVVRTNSPNVGSQFKDR